MAGETRLEVWTALDAALPPGWRVGLWTYDRERGEVTVTAVGPRVGDCATLDETFILGRGCDAPAAVRALTAALEARAR